MLQSWVSNVGTEDEQTKKIRGRLVETINHTDGHRMVVVDTVFSGKVELVFNESSDGDIPESGAWVNVIHSNTNPPVVTRIWSNDESSKTESSVQETSISLGRKSKKPQGPVRSLRGELVNASVNETSSGRFGSITVKLHTLEINLIVGPDSVGEMPPIGSYVSVNFEDSKVPRVIDFQKTDDTSIMVPEYTPMPRDPWLVRWPKACMSCGETDIFDLSLQENIWVTDIDKPKVVEGSGEKVLRIVNAIMLSAFTPAPGASVTKPKKLYLSVSLPIQMYTCKDCKRLRLRYQDCMDISLAPSENNQLKYHFEFESPKYEEYFRDHNPSDITPKIDTQEH